MKRYIRWTSLIALSLLAAILLTGCTFNMAEIIEDAAVGETPVPEATPMPELTAALFPEYDPVYAHYNEVAFTDTLPGLSARYGEPRVETTTSGDVESTSYTWVFDDGYGFVCAFYDNGKLRAKVIYYDDIRQFRELSNASYLKNAYDLNDSSTFQDCIALFGGRPIEICQVSQSETDASNISRVYSWIDMSDQMVQILFEKDGTISSISTQLQE